MSLIAPQDELSIDDSLDAQRDIVRRSLNALANESVRRCVTQV
jgi:hypothetical protein